MDQATAVFSIRDVAAADEGSGKDPDPGSPATGDKGSAPAEEPGDARLRAAVAAWVSSDPKEADNAAEGGESAPGEAKTEPSGDAERESDSGPGTPETGAAAEPAAPADTDAAEAAAEAAVPKGAAPARGAAPEAATPEEGAAKPEAAESKDAAPAKVGGAEGEAATPEAAEPTDAAPATGAAPAEDATPGADAATPEAAEPTDAAPAKGPTPAKVGDARGEAATPEAAEPTDATPGRGAAPAKDATPGADAATPEAAEPTGAVPAKGPMPAKVGDAEGEAATPEAAEPKDGVPAKEAAPAKGPMPPKADDAKGQAAKPEAAEPTDATPAKGPTPAKDATPAKADDAKPKLPAVADAKPAESKSSTADEAKDAKDAKDAPADKPVPADAKADKQTSADVKADKPAPGAGGRGKDQPTAVFKAVAPPVDQPTTMLKAPGTQTPGAKAPGTQTPGTKAHGASARVEESEAERTSRFVPLKPLDDKAAQDTPGKKATGRPAEPPVAERTTQQPLPPKPPLDLLAELTNTPPPPETRVRTTVRRVKIWTPLVLLLVVVFAVVQAVRPLPTPTLDLTTRETVSFEGGKPSVPWPGQGQAAMDVNGIGTFGTSGDQKPVPIASIAKVMTVYLILRDHPLKPGEKGPKIPVDAAAQKHYETGKAEKESVVKVTEGQQISEYEALQAVMLPSANNIAKLLARWDGKSSSEDAFVDKMNKTAGELGMKNTTYTDPSGLDKTTVSTATDLVKLGRAAMENPVFKEISRQPDYIDLNGEKQKNFFGLVPTAAIGIKTGTTTAAGGNILFAAEKQVDGKTQTIIGAALGQYGRNGVANIDEVTEVVKRLIQSGQGALTAKKIVKKGDVVGRVDDGLGGTTPVVATKDVSAVGWSGLTVRLKLDEQKGKTLPNTAKAGTQVGVLTVGDGKNDTDAVEVPVALQKDLAEPGFGAKLRRIG
ncbi:D-alanyl-D-alanine carboxypeptidase [Streptomyces sp. NPDC102406]|uniref:D-alanyl-D-alanine carboxypeptidase n=1 Tax=Streptomyces sp. NPDC102406 TaxID=3366171 RepID=UPI0037FB9D25